MAVYTSQSTDEFERIINSGRPVLVDFWAEWCPPCHAMAPVLEAAAKKNDKADVLKVDIEATADNQNLAMHHGVQSIPNMKLFVDGKIVDEYIGITPQAVIDEAFAKHVR